MDILTDCQAIMCVVNSGFGDAVMDAAKEFGARGGTIIHARGTANSESEKLFGITIQPEKEIVIILARGEIRDSIMHAVYQKVRLYSPGQGIAFSIPVDKVIGIPPAQKEKD